MKKTNKAASCTIRVSWETKAKIRQKLAKLGISESDWFNRFIFSELNEKKSLERDLDKAILENRKLLEEQEEISRKLKYQQLLITAIYEDIKIRDGEKIVDTKPVIKEAKPVIK